MFTPHCSSAETFIASTAGMALIGHSKEHRDDAHFERFLAAVAADPALEVVSMSEVAERLGAGATGLNVKGSNVYLNKIALACPNP